ncbi:MAG: hypothetical protein WCI31_15970 [Prolixibacteraceae bacterium]
MTTKARTNAFKVTYRQCLDFLNAADELKFAGDFGFRCALAAIVREAKKEIDIFNGAQEPSPGLSSFKSEVALHRENCTVEMDGKKIVDVEAYMDLYEKTRIKYANALDQGSKLKKEANKALDNEVDIFCDPIPLTMLEKNDKELKFGPMILSAILPFSESVN